MKTTLLIPILLLGMVACKTSEDSSTTAAIKTQNQTKLPENKAYEIIEIDNGNNSGFIEKQQLVIKNKTDFKTYWKEAYSNYLKVPELPEIDFSKKMLILVALGERTSGGFDVKIASIFEGQKNSLLINVKETAPGDNCVTTEALTYPYQLIETDYFAGKIIFNEEKEVINCGEK